jgi:hypothetical protein
MPTGSIKSSAVQPEYDGPKQVCGRFGGNERNKTFFSRTDSDLRRMTSVMSRCHIFKQENKGMM